MIISCVTQLTASICSIHFRFDTCQTFLLLVCVCVSVKHFESKWAAILYELKK